MSNDEAEKAAREYARRYQDHSIDSLVYAIRPETTTLAEGVFLAGVNWKVKQLITRLKRQIEEYEEKGLHEMVTALTVLECELEAEI